MAQDSEKEMIGGAPEEYFLSALKRGEFLLQRCTESGRFVFHPRTISPWSGAATLEWVPACGRGRVYSTTTVRRRPAQGGDYNVSLIDLEEGVRMMSRVEGIEPGKVRIDLPVTASIDTSHERPLIVFLPTGN